MAKGRASKRCGPAIGSIRLCVEQRGRLPKNPIKGPEDVCKAMRGAGNLDRESFFALYLDNANNVVATEEVAKGQKAGVHIDRAEIAKAALLTNASRVIVAHNHPSGNVNPSGDDVSVTRAVSRALETIGIELLDHVVVGRRGCSSLAERGLASAAGLAGYKEDGSDET